MQYITGTQKVINNLMMQKSKFLRDLGTAVEKTCVDVANHAKAAHAGNMAHMNQRYQNRTSTLTRSIAHELEEVSFKGITGVVFANIEYAAFVELGTVRNRPYPFLYPALAANKPNFENRIKRALRR